MNNLNSNNSLYNCPNLIKIFPFPVCLISETGELLVSNESGEAIYIKLSKQFIKEIIEQSQDNKVLTSNVGIDTKEYLIKFKKVRVDSKEYVVSVTFIEMNSASAIPHQKDLYQSTIKDLQIIFDNSYDVIYVTDGNGKTLRVSSASEVLWGKKPEELVGRSVYELEQEGIFSPSATRKALEQGKKVKIMQSTNTGHHLMVVSTPIRDIDGNIIRVVNASRDITEVKVLGEELKEMRTMIQGYRMQLSKTKTDKLHRLVYESSEMSNLISTLPKIASSDSTVLVMGETGVGKEVIVNYIHKFSLREGNPFIKINCASIPENLLESELFGYEKGAFTGANREGKAGLFELANEGTLFLDEIGEMSINLQAKLLRILQENEVMRIGGKKSKKVDVRIITATNQCLKSKIKEGLFRSDLYYRLNVIPIRIPPLRHRQDDILPLTQHFLSMQEKKLNGKKNFSEEVLYAFKQYLWPGNVRELQNMVERLVVTSDKSEIHLDTIPNYIKDSLMKMTTSNLNSSEVTFNQKNEKILPLNDAVGQLEKQLIQRAAQKSKNLNEIATLLGVSQSTISRKIKKYNINL